VASWAGRFGFDPRYLKQPYGSLSGGEKARLRIAKLMLETPDILLLDEPTNDLDISTLEVLEDSLIEFEGALILVTHDRYMMGTICDTYLGLDGNGNIEQYASFEQYLKDMNTSQKRETQETPTAIQPKVSSTPSKSKTKLNYKEQRELNLMEESIKKAETEVSKLSREIESNTNPEKLQGLCDELSKAQSKVDSLYIRWEELEKK
jgi:ATP-binding cassette subfamily F protein uup